MELKSSRDSLRSAYSAYKVLDKTAKSNISGDKTNPNRKEQIDRVKRCLQSEISRLKDIMTASEETLKAVEEELSEVEKL